MVDRANDQILIVQRAIAAYEGLIALYAQDAPGNKYFTHCLAEAQTHRNGLQERLDSPNPNYLADVFNNNFYHSIDHFFESHRGEYESDMPKPNSDKAAVAGQCLQELLGVIDAIIRVKRTQRSEAE